MISTIHLFSPIGTLAITGDEQAVHSVAFVETSGPADHGPTAGAAVRACHDQLGAYFDGRLHTFDVPLMPSGTTFQQKVWTLLHTIPYGRTSSYRELAIRLGDTGLTRAVGMANGRNPIVILIPCHRIIGTDGRLTGYSAGIYRKRWLIDHEQALKQGRLF
jgi:methylated-DNA-[protein]-cysteine S-methyltransferase